MKRKRRLSGVLLIIAALIIMQLPVSEADAATSASDFKMEGTTLVKYRGTETDVSIPNTVEVIAESAFDDNDDIKRVVIPDSVTTIEPYAFWGCDNLNTVVLGRGLTEIGDYTFTNCKGLTQVTIPSSVDRIGIKAFADCVNLTDITIPTEVKLIHETAFDGCYKLYIHCEAGSIAYEYSKGFYEKQAEMPEYEDVPNYEDSEKDTSQTVSDSATDSTGTSDANTDSSLLGSTWVVGNNAVVFMDNTNIKVHAGNETDPGVEEDGEITADVLPSFEQGTLPKYTIVDGKIVADQAYYKNQTLKQVVLPEGIEEIGQFAFSRSSVTGIEIPEGVKDICYGAFYHCDDLQTVSLPSTIENVEPKAFAYTAWVEEFMANGTEDFLISGNVLVAYRGSGANVVIPEGVTVIAGEAFMNQTQIKSVTLPESLITVGEGAFEGCTSLAGLNVLSRHLSQIKDRAFAGCSLTEVDMPSSVKAVGLLAFDEDVFVTYEGGEIPVTTHEVSAERLSNEDYRMIIETEDGAEDKKEGVVQVTGIKNAYAILEGAVRDYTLSITAAKDKEPMETAYRRSYQTEMPENMTVYDLRLTDSSEIPLTKLGKQILTVTLPVPTALSQEDVIVYTLDRNGQLEKLDSERVSLDGVDAVRFQTTHLSLFGICGAGSGYRTEQIIEVSTTIQSMSEGPGSADSSMITNSHLSYVKWGLGAILLLAGIVNLLNVRSIRKKV